MCQLKVFLYYQGCPTVSLSHQRATGASQHWKSQKKLNPGIFHKNLTIEPVIYFT